MQLNSPVGRLVQGMPAMQQQRDTETNDLLWLDEEKTKPKMGIFFALAFPKVLPNGANNDEFDEFWGGVGQVAIDSWSQFFDEQGNCTNPKFSWKLQDGDGVDGNGKSVADKPGFAGHWIVKFSTDYPVKCFYDGKFAEHEVMEKPESIFKRGYWGWVACEVRSNRADLSKRQVPGISIYPQLISFIGGRKEDEISSGPNAQEVLGGRKLGWRPDGVSAVPGAPVGGGRPGALPRPGGPAGAARQLPASPSTAVTPRPGPGSGLKPPGARPGPGGPAGKPLTPPVKPVLTLTQEVLDQGYTLEALRAEYTDEQIVAEGWGTMSTPAAKPGIGKPPLKPPVKPSAPKCVLNEETLATGATLDGLIADGWTEAALVEEGYATMVG